MAKIGYNSKVDFSWKYSTFDTIFQEKNTLITLCSMAIIMAAGNFKLVAIFVVYSWCILGWKNSK